MSDDCARCSRPLPEEDSVDNPIGIGVLHNDCRTDMLRGASRCVICADPVPYGVPACGGCTREYREDMQS
jgi:hypothetical protein